jgi:predicted negative regulator of RcsB-dependent stress response
MYLEAAALADPPPAGAVALDARLRAARALAAAGLRRDARAQMEWVARHARDKALQDMARRELQRP